MVFTSIEALSASSELRTGYFGTSVYQFGHRISELDFRMGIDHTLAIRIRQEQAGEAHYRAVIFRFTRLSILRFRIILMGANN